MFVVIDVAVVALLVASLVEFGATDAMAARLRRSAPFVLFAVALMVATEVGSAHELFWPGHNQFPSGTLSLMTSLALGIAARQPRWLRPLALAVTIVAVLMVLADGHTPAEAAAGVAFGVVASLVARLWLPFWRRTADVEIVL